MKVLGRVVLLFFLFFISFFSVYSAVEVFSDYDTTIKIESDNKINVNKHIILRNIHTVGIVPGQLEFKVDLGDSDDLVFLQDTLKITNQYGNEISYKIFNSGTEYVIVLNIIQPLLPGFEYTINIDYDLQFNTKGFLFKSLMVPLKENLTVPIWGGDFILELPENRYFTYVDFSNYTKLDDRSISISLDDKTPATLGFEYSFIPINVFDMRGSYVFWVVINMILIIILFFEIRREVKRLKDKD